MMTRQAAFEKHTEMKSPWGDHEFIVAKQGLGVDIWLLNLSFKYRSPWACRRARQKGLRQTQPEWIPVINAAVLITAE